MSLRLQVQIVLERRTPEFILFAFAAYTQKWKNKRLSGDLKWTQKLARFDLELERAWAQTQEPGPQFMANAMSAYNTVFY